MHKIFLSAVTLAILAATACTKDENKTAFPAGNPNNNPVPTIPAPPNTNPGPPSHSEPSQWTVDTMTYKSGTNVYVTRLGLKAVDSAQSGNAISFNFAGGPPKSGGTYTASANGAAGQQVEIVATDMKSQGSYLVRSGTVTITFIDGKYAIQMPPSPAFYQGITSKPDVLVSLDIWQ